MRARAIQQLHVEPPGLEPAQKHKMRRFLKKLRYLTEFFAPLVPGKKVKPIVKQLKTLQDVFGYVNDVRMAGQLQTIVADRGEAPDCAVATGTVPARMKKNRPRPGRMRKKSSASCQRWLFRGGGRVATSHGVCDALAALLRIKTAVLLDFCGFVGEVSVFDRVAEPV
jgi:hypothetical protein